jgi:CHASE3 domain sensor protein
MTTEEVLLTVLTVAIVVLIVMVLVVLFTILRIVKKVNTTIHSAQHIANTGSKVFTSIAPVRLVIGLLRASKKR